MLEEDLQHREEREKGNRGQEKRKIKSQHGCFARSLRAWRSSRWREGRLKEGILKKGEKRRGRKEKGGRERDERPSIRPFNLIIKAVSPPSSKSDSDSLPRHSHPHFQPLLQPPSSPAPASVAASVVVPAPSPTPHPSHSPPFSSPQTPHSVSHSSYSSSYHPHPRYSPRSHLDSHYHLQPSLHFHSRSSSAHATSSAQRCAHQPRRWAAIGKIARRGGWSGGGFGARRRIGGVELGRWWGSWEWRRCWSGRWWGGGRRGWGLLVLDLFLCVCWARGVYVYV